jgi:hypothetical protein
MGRAAEAQSEPKAAIATKIELLIHENAKNTEIVGFADRSQHPVRVVRGKLPRSGTTAAHRFDETAALAGTRNTPVGVLRGGPAVVAAVPVVTSAMPVRRPIEDAPQLVVFAGREAPVTILRGAPATVSADLPVETASPYLDLFDTATGADLDRVAFAVDGAESSHGTDPAMWRAELGGPQGPMQVSAAAAIDSGDGDRFDLIRNRQLGRAYLARLFGRYGNWPDAIAAYNWGPGNMDAWIGQGRPTVGLPLGVARYRERVLHDGGILQGPGLR